MPKDTGRQSTQRAQQRGRTRRPTPRREQEVRERVSGLFRSPHVTFGLVTALVFVVVCTLIAIMARESPLVAVGRVMNETRIVRVPFEVVDAEATLRARERARERIPRVYAVDTEVLNHIASSVENLPRVIARAETVEDIDESVRDQFGLTEELLQAIVEHAVDGEPSTRWQHWADAFADRLRDAAILDRQVWQREVQESISPSLDLRDGEWAARVGRDRAASVDDEDGVRRIASAMARDAGFPSEVRQAIVRRVLSEDRPTYQPDTEATEAAREAAASAVEPVRREIREGQTLFRRGEVLDRAQYELYTAELNRFLGEAEPWRVWTRRASIAGAVFAVTAGLVGYTSLFCPRIRRSTSRMVWVASLMALALGLACLLTVLDPRLWALTAVAPTVLACVILVIAYEQRTAMAYAALHGVLVCVALNLPIGVYALILTGVGVAVWRLAEIRDRNTLIRMGVWVAVALGLGTILISLIDRPINPLTMRETLTDAGLAAFGGLLVGGVTMFILPTIERVFDITTGMTLIELRDPKQPLLRELQQRAPGSYNHSLNVANISEAAAASIGADPLLTYVGALYHDIGKMNKPEYFVENQSGGPNKHDKLSPAMSLLVIVGHVKDGVELAKEYGLPRSLLHFIEAHHGTTLVEFFYNRARKQAVQQAMLSSDPGTETGPETPADNPAVPNEFEYRYPGPKPRSKEVAILMLADAVESATRTLAEPTPSRIDTLVRAMANKRLLDGQFDECNLTLRELHTIVESISKTLASIYHGRIAYPAGGEARRAAEPAQAGQSRPA